jgi:excisionase family DNA binding protein
MTTAAGRLAITIAELAFALGISQKTIRNQLAAGVFPIRSTKIGGRRIFSLTEVERFLDGPGTKCGRPRKASTFDLY